MAVVFWSLYNGAGPLGVVLGVDSERCIPLYARGVMRCDAMLGCLEACYMLVSDLAEAKVRRSREMPLIDRGSMTVEISHETVDLCGAAVLDLSGMHMSIKDQALDRYSIHVSTASTTAASVPLPQRNRSG
jgi:hypothetical protein